MERKSPPPEPRIVRVRRIGDVDLQFRGASIAFASSRRSKDGSIASSRWTELEVFQTDSGKFVLVATGKTEVEGEVDKPSAVMSESLEELVRSLYLTGLDGRKFLSHPAKLILEQIVSRFPMASGLSVQKI